MERYCDLLDNNVLNALNIKEIHKKLFVLYCDAAKICVLYSDIQQSAYITRLLCNTQSHELNIIKKTLAV